MTKQFTKAAGLCLGLALVLTLPAMAQQNKCADCHFARPDAPDGGHLAAWDRSAHSRNNVGCEKCHGGDATTFEPLFAHRSILNSSNPASAVNRQNLSKTCGACHAGPYIAFQTSQHFALLEKRDARVPVCTTCHGAAGFNRPSAKALEVQCAQCHGPKGIAPRPETAEAARTLYDALRESRDVLKAAKPMIARVSNSTRRAQLDDAYEQAEVLLILAAKEGHRFVYDELKARLFEAQQRIEALFGQIVNPKP